MLFRRVVRLRHAVRKLFIETMEERRLMAFTSLDIDANAYDDNEFLVRFTPSTASSLATQTASTRFGDATVTKALTDDGWFSVSVDSSSQLASAMEAFRQRPDVLVVSPDFELSVTSTANDANYTSQWGLSNRGLSGGLVGADIGAEQAWSYGTSSNVVVGIIDTGIDYNHPDLVANIWRNGSEIVGNGIDDDRNGYIDDTRGWDFANNDADPMDDNGHGTHVAGIVGASGNNGQGISGVTWNVKLMPLKFMDADGSGSLSDAIEAVNYARTMGAKIINASWGGGGFSQALQRAISQFQTSGGIFVAAAGNESSNNATTPAYPANYTGVVSVGASTRSDLLAGFSNFGSNVTIVAPGSSILSTLPNNRYGTLSGTSMASPFVAGALALLWGQNPTASASAITQAVLEHTDNVLRGSTSQYGRLDVGKAAAALKGNTSSPVDPNPNPNPIPTPQRVKYAINQPVYLSDAGTRSSRTTSIGMDVNADFNVQDLNIQLNIAHTYLSDLTVRLVGPDGTTATLIDRRGGTGDHLRVTFDDEAINSIASVRTATTISGAFRSEQALSVFQNKSAKGRWTLQITDQARGDVGFLTSATLDFLPRSNATSRTTPSPNAASLNGVSVDRRPEWLQAFQAVIRELDDRLRR